MHSDDSSEFRIITIRFLERDLQKLMQLEESLRQDPTNQVLRQKWVQELREYAGRVQRVTSEWESRYLQKSVDSQSFAVPLARIKTPPKSSMD